MSDIAEEMSDNLALRSILAEARQIQFDLLAVYTGITGVNDQAVSDIAPYTRPANELCVRTVITNSGGTSVRIKEMGVLVAILAANGTWTSPLRGSEEVVIDCASGSSVVSIATYIRDELLFEDGNCLIIS